MINKVKKSLMRAPKGMFVVMGNVGTNTVLLHSHCDSLGGGVRFAKGIFNGKNLFLSSVIKKPEEFTSIDVIDDTGIIQCSLRATYATSIDIVIEHLRKSVTDFEG